MPSFRSVPGRLLCALALTSLAVLGGCSKKRIAECDEFVATVEKIARCEQLPASSRPQVEASAKAIKDALEMVDQAGGLGSAPADLVKTLRDTCRTQDRAIIEQYSKLMPDCLE